MKDVESLMCLFVSGIFTLSVWGFIFIECTVEAKVLDLNILCVGETYVYIDEIINNRIID